MITGKKSAQSDAEGRLESVWTVNRTVVGGQTELETSFTLVGLLTGHVTEEAFEESK